MPSPAAPPGPLAAQAVDPLADVLRALGPPGVAEEPSLRGARDRVRAAQAARQGPWQAAARLPAGQGNLIVDGQGRALGHLLWEGRLLRWQGADGTAWQAPALPP